MRDAAKRETRFLDAAPFELQRGGNRHQRERIRQAVADLQITVVRREALRGKLDGCDDFVRAEIGVAPAVCRRAAGGSRRTLSRAARRTRHMNLRFERSERDAHVGRMRRDAGLAGAEDRVDPIDAVDGRTAAAGLAFVARRRHVIEIKAARPLHQVAAGRRHIAKLLRGAGQDRARQ